MLMTSKYRAMAAALYVVLGASGASGQTFIHDCLTDYATGGVQSQTGPGMDSRVYQPMPVQSEPYTVTHITAIVQGDAPQGDPPVIVAFDGADFVGRTITIEFLFGEFDDVNDVFVEDTSIARPPAVDVVLTAEMVSEAVEDPSDKEKLDIDAIVLVPTGKHLHIGLIAQFSADDGEGFAVPESTTCAGQESAWWSFLDGQSTIQGRVSEVGGFVTGMNAIQVDVQMGIAVPTVSEWGAAAMTLLILTAGTLVYRYRMPTTVAA